MIFLQVQTRLTKIKAGQVWADWLGTGHVASSRMTFRSFEDARSYVRSLNLKSQPEWAAYCKGEISKKGVKPADIPAVPERVYKNDGWNGLGDWLGTGRIATHLRKYRSFEEARDFVRSLGLKKWDEWADFCKSDDLPDDVPACPNKVYKTQGWAGNPDWLGTDTKSKHHKA